MRKKVNSSNLSYIYSRIARITNTYITLRSLENFYIKILSSLSYYISCYYLLSRLIIILLLSLPLLLLLLLLLLPLPLLPPLPTLSLITPKEFLVYSNNLYYAYSIRLFNSYIKIGLYTAYYLLGKAKKLINLYLELITLTIGLFR